MNKLTGKRAFLLGVILVIGFLLRFIFLSTNPPAMHADEADTGYTALTLIETGMDTYGNAWPLHFQDPVNNYRPPLSTYSVIPFVLLFGLNPVTERFPSVVFGTLLILCVYFLAKKLLLRDDVAIIAAFLTAINPWSIHLSRTGLEVQLSCLLVASGILFFELSKERKYFLIISSVAFSLSLFSYHPAKIVTPLILLVLFLSNFKRIFAMKIFMAVSILLFAVSCSVVAYLALNGEGASEFHNVSIFNNARAKRIVDIQRTNSLVPLSISGIFSNKATYYIREFTNIYINPLSLNYLFVNGENNLDKGIGNYGQYHLFELPAFIVGLFALWRKHRKALFLLAGWMALGLIPGAITMNGNYAYRDVNALVPPLLISAFGFFFFFSHFKRQTPVIVSFFTISLILFAYFFYNYYFSYPIYSRDWWGYSQKEALYYAAKKDSPVIIHGGPDWAILYAFYNREKNEKFQSAYIKSVQLNEGYINLDNLYIGNLIEEKGDLDYLKTLPQEALVIVPGGHIEAEPIVRFMAADGGTNLSVYVKKK